MKPYCFVDVDGVLNTVTPNAETGHTMNCRGFNICIPKTFQANIERLMEKFDMAWLTTWEHSANEEFSTFFGWDEWPVVEWATKHYDGDRTCKLGGLNIWFKEHGARPFVFIDDDAAYEPQWSIDAIAEWGEPFKIITPNLYTGLTDDQTDEALAWAEENVQ